MRRVTGIGGLFFTVEEGELGRFAWATDPDGNRLELWEPPEEKAGG